VVWVYQRGISVSKRPQACLCMFVKDSLDTYTGRNGMSSFHLTHCFFHLPEPIYEQQLNNSSTGSKKRNYTRFVGIQRKFPKAVKLWAKDLKDWKLASLRFKTIRPSSNNSNLEKRRVYVCALTRSALPSTESTNCIRN
jgi:hypothetical protein